MNKPTPAETQAAVKRLHELYCQLTGRDEKLRFYERRWFELLRAEEYQHDAELLWKDLQHLVRYLRMGIRDGKRNAGALKLENLLNDSKFFSDLAEAKAVLRPAKVKAPVLYTKEPAAVPITEELGKEMASGLREFLDRGMKLGEAP